MQSSVDFTYGQKQYIQSSKNKLNLFRAVFRSQNTYFFLFYVDPAVLRALINFCEGRQY